MKIRKRYFYRRGLRPKSDDIFAFSFHGTNDSDNATGLGALRMPS
jgi:hypothetical protein